MKARCALAALLLLLCAVSQTNAAKQHKYKDNEKIILWANKGESISACRTSV
jgi:hypothetical protein